MDEVDCLISVIDSSVEKPVLLPAERHVIAHCQRWKKKGDSPHTSPPHPIFNPAVFWRQRKRHKNKTICREDLWLVTKAAQNRSIFVVAKGWLYVI